LTGIWIYNYRELLYYFFLLSSYFLIFCSIGFCVYFGVLLLVRFIIEVIHQRFNQTISDISSPVRFKNGFAEIIQDLEKHSAPMSKLVTKYPNLKWCLLNNSIYDLSKFEHPGGQFIIQQINGIHPKILFF